MITNKTVSFALTASSLFFLAVTPCFAGNDYAAGSQAYSKGDYKTALPLFQKAEAQFPTNALVHYQLANTYMQMHQLGAAKAEYNKCLNLNPGATLSQYCHKFLDNYNSSPSGTTSASAPASVPPAAPSGGRQGNHPTVFAGAPHALGEKGEPYRPSGGGGNESDLDRRKREITQEAEKQAQTIRQEAQNQIKALDENSNQRVRDPNTGEIKLGVAGSQADNIRDEAEQKAKAIIDRAQDRVRHMN